MSEKKLSDWENIMIIEKAIFTKRAKDIVNHFCSEWKDSFYNDKVYFDEGITNVSNGKIYTFKVTAINVSTLKKMYIMVTGNLLDSEPSRHVYTTSVNVDSDRLINFKKGSFNPLSLRDHFQAFYIKLLNYDDGEKKHNSLYLVFNEDATILNARIVFTIYKDGEASRADHNVYHAHDIEILRSHNLVRTGTENYRNFEFLWEYTSLKTIMNESSFIKAYELYAADVDSYHSLLQMERI